VDFLERGVGNSKEGNESTTTILSYGEPKARETGRILSRRQLRRAEHVLFYAEMSKLGNMDSAANEG
jgi:hypothetical protein